MTSDYGTTERTQTQEAALAYAERKVPIFPLIDKKPIERAGYPNVDGVVIPEGMGGFHQSTTDMAKIERWWAAYPDANIGTPTGAHTDAMTGQPNAHPFDVLDIDVDKGGLESIRVLMEANQKLPDTACQITGTNGFHYCFQASAGLRNSAGDIAPGIDVRATGGYIVLAPSIHPDTGKPYEWQVPLLSPEGIPQFTPWPEWLATVVRESQRKRAGGEAGARIPKGIQEAALMRLAGAMRRQGSTEPEILAAITVVSQERCDPPVKERDLERMAHSACNYDAESEIVTAAKTDLGNADRLVAHAGGTILYNTATRGWHIYDGVRWLEDRAGKINTLASEVARAVEMAAINMRLGITATSPADDIANTVAMERWAKYCQSAKGLEAMVKLARDMRAVLPEALDTDPDVLNCQNGTIDLRTGELRPHDPADLITKLAPVDYDPDARLEEWDTTLSTACEGKEGLPDFLQEAFGYSATGDTREDKLFAVIGPTRGSKTTIIGAVQSALGEYATTADFSTFLKKHSVNSSGPSGDVARLKGQRYVTSIEVDEGKALAEGLVKQMTGGDTITARHLHQSEIEFKATHKLWLVANDAPIVKGDDEALWVRILRIPFENQIPPGKRDLGLKARLADTTYAGPAVLAWIVAGAVRWHAEGLLVPDCITKATEQYQEDMDPLNQFVDESCELGPKLKVAPGDLWYAYVSHCKLFRAKPMGKKAFKENLAKRGVEQQRSGKQLYVGIMVSAAGADD